jgi:hypothetical protein
MALQFSDAVRNARADAVESTTGTAARLQIRSGTVPANCAAADAGTLLCEITLPSDWLSAASGGVKSLSGTWAGTGAAAGTAAHFRLKNSAGSTTHLQGTVTATGGGGDLTLNNTSIAASQAVSVTTFTLTEAGA